MDYKFAGKRCSLNRFFLRTGRFEKAEFEWIHLNKDIIQNHYREAFSFFYPEEAQQEYDEAEEELQDLKNTCGRKI